MWSLILAVCGCGPHSKPVSGNRTSKHPELLVQWQDLITGTECYFKICKNTTVE